MIKSMILSLLTIIGFAFKNAPKLLKVSKIPITVSTGYILLNSSILNGQNFLNFSDFSNHTYGLYKTNSPTNVHGDRYEMLKMADDTLIFRGSQVFFPGITTTTNIDPTSNILWGDNTSMFRVTPFSSITFPYSQITNTPSLFSGSFVDLISKPTTISGYGITDAETKSAISGSLNTKFDNPSGNTSQYIKGDGNLGSISTLSTSYTGSTGINIIGTTITNTAPDQVITLTSMNNDLTISGSYPNFSITAYVPTTFTVSRSINSSTFQISSTRHADAIYNIGISCTASIGSNASGLVQLQYSINNGSTWINYSRIKNSNTVTLAIALQSINDQESIIFAENIPAGAILRIVPTNSGTTTITSILGFETY